jgi:beta-lactamase superfamily II metal-dependent hydrolase
MLKKKAGTTTKTKTTSKTGSDASAQTAAKSAGAGGQIKVRMYKQGLGDCFLIGLPRDGGKTFYMMIDCGVILGTPNPGDIMQKVVGDIIKTTGGHIDVLVVTHEHWDHLSGFLQAQQLFSQLHVENLWMAWTEDPKDALANELRAAHQALRMALGQTAARMGVAGNSRAAHEVSGMLEFFGAAGSGTTTDALKFVKGLTPSIRYCRPSDPPFEFDGVKAKIYALGPPHDKKQIMKFNPSKKTPETYGLAAADNFLGGVGPALADDDTAMPFDNSFQIPLDVAQQMQFFQRFYWGEDTNSSQKDQSWRRIDDAWLDSGSSLALQLDSATNNTSLALAIELENDDVLLFAADAQVGNWLSWQDLHWNSGSRNVTGPDLLRRVKIYKAGHHGSHNATLREKGLEMMEKLEMVLIPVDHAMAIKKRWGNMPLPELVDRMKEITKGRVVRVDEPVPDELKGRVDDQTLYFEISV